MSSSMRSCSRHAHSNTNNANGSLSNSGSNISATDYKPKKLKFSVEEDHQLRGLVKQYGTKSWTLISNELKGRTPRQCRDRWKHYLCPEANLAEWTKDEDQILLQHFTTYGNHWAKIASFFPGRTAVSVRNRCCRLLKQISKQQPVSSNTAAPANIIPTNNSSSNSTSINALDDEANKQQGPTTYINLFLEPYYLCSRRNSLEKDHEASTNVVVGQEQQLQNSVQQKVHLPPCMALPFPPIKSDSILSMDLMSLHSSPAILTDCLIDYY